MNNAMKKKISKRRGHCVKKDVANDTNKERARSLLSEWFFFSNRKNEAIVSRHCNSVNCRSVIYHSVKK